MPATVAFFGRATGIVSLPASLAADLQTELGMNLRVAGLLEESTHVLQRAIEVAHAAADLRVEMRARMESAFVRVMLHSETGDELLEVTERAIPIFEAAGDDRSLGRALTLAGWLGGGRRGRHRLRLSAAERALVCYRRSTWPVSTPVGEIANALYSAPRQWPTRWSGATSSFEPKTSIETVKPMSTCASGTGRTGGGPRPRARPHHVRAYDTRGAGPADIRVNARCCDPR